MIRKKIFHIFLGTIQAGLVMLLLGACSTTKHLPEGEVLYTGSRSKRLPVQRCWDSFLSLLKCGLTTVWFIIRKDSGAGSLIDLPPILPYSFLLLIRRYVPRWVLICCTIMDTLMVRSVIRLCRTRKTA